MEVVYAQEPFPTVGKSSIFLAGPSPRDQKVVSWRYEALRLLQALGFEGHVYVPEPRNGDWGSLDPSQKNSQIVWEEQALNRSDVIVFWVPRDMKKLPGLTTNDEWGVWKDSGKVVWGSPIEAPHTNYQKFYANKYKVPCTDSLEATLAQALLKVSKLRPVTRFKGELTVPLHIWNTKEFQSWHKNQLKAGNRLEEAEVLSSFWGGSTLVFWSMKVNMWVGAEKRHKTNEVMFSRPDISTVVLHGPVYVDNIGGTDIVLVREFRSPANNFSGFILESPGGSSSNPTDTPLEIAVTEVLEETGSMMEPTRFVTHETRQMIGTMSLHRSSLFSVELTAKEVEWFRSQEGVTHGEQGSSEVTHIAVKTLREVMSSQVVDWSQMGMILTTILKSSGLMG